MSQIDIFKKYYIETKEEIDKNLEKFNKTFIKEENPIIKDNFEFFKDLNSDGKNIRGTLVKLGYSLLKDDQHYSTSLALAYEVFQTAILVHDDIIDKDNKRRGKDTIHYRNYQKYKDEEIDVSHFSNSIGICMGDYGLYAANKIITDSYIEDKNLGKVLSYFNETVLNTIKGELLDVILPVQSKMKKIKNPELEKSIMDIYRLKTAYYTIVGPLGVGMLLAGADENKIEEITRFGEKVGIAFQIQDDILGIYSEEMGKVKGSDIKEFKQTILYSHILGTKQEQEFQKYYGNDLKDDSVEKVKRLFEESSSKQYAIETMNKLYDESLEILENIKWIKNDKKEILKGLIEYLRMRNK